IGRTTTATAATSQHCSSSGRRCGGPGNQGDTWDLSQDSLQRKPDAGYSNETSAPSLPRRTWQRIADPKPFLAGSTIAGPPLSIQSMRKRGASAPRSIDHEIVTTPLGVDNAPYLKAFVANS